MKRLTEVARDGHCNIDYKTVVRYFRFRDHHTSPNQLQQYAVTHALFVMLSFTNIRGLNRNSDFVH